MPGKMRFSMDAILAEAKTGRKRRLLDAHSEESEAATPEKKPREADEEESREDREGSPVVEGSADGAGSSSSDSRDDCDKALDLAERKKDREWSSDGEDDGAR